MLREFVAGIREVVMAICKKEAEGFGLEFMSIARMLRYLPVELVPLENQQGDTKITTECM